MGKLENEYQANLIKKLKKIFPGCRVLKNDPNYIQGYPDLTVLHGNRWAVLEVKKSEKDFLNNKQPNQEFYICEADAFSFGAFIYPENEEEVLYGLQQSFSSVR